MNLTPPPDLPPPLEDRWHRVQERLRALPDDTFGPYPRAAETVARVAVCSDFVLSTLLRQPGALLGRLADDQPLSAEQLHSRLRLGQCSEAEALATLRRCRHVEMARIAWRDLAGWSSIETNLADLSLLADCMIESALEYAAGELAPRFGRPVDANGEAESLLILAMGKLGGNELNFSSDVDLVLLYADSIVFKGHSHTRSDEYFRRLGQVLIKLLDQVTADGVAFRVDTRLRPFGSSGPLAVSLPALENYLIRHGRDWERYAYQKARLITGRRHASELFDEILIPFVYRRYVDYGVFRALREMKTSIAQEVARRNLADNVKLGSGGIREIEFIVQAFQLVRGGQSPGLRKRSLLAALERLGAAGLLESGAVAGLGRAYRFLRTIENRIQAMEDRQTHNLPTEPGARSGLAYAMAMSGWEELAAEIGRQRGVVETQFARLAFEERGENRREQLNEEQWAAAWERADLGSVLADTGIEQADAVAEELNALRTGNLYRRMDEPSRQRLADVVARLMPRLSRYRNPSWIVSRLVPLLRAVARRSAYLALLSENPPALRRLLTVAQCSEFLVSQVAEHPGLLDELLDERAFNEPPSRPELERELERIVRLRGAEDLETRLEAMRAFQLGAVFRIALADRLQNLSLMRVSDRLTDTAELILQYALDVACSEQVERYGKPLAGQGDARREAGFAVVGYGKLGGLELGYGSDLDLIFLHESLGEAERTAGPESVDNRVFFARLAQRLINFLSIQTRSGRLYEVDTRLRPNGRAGVLVSSMKAFTTYQTNKAWVWEHQALLRSRAVAGAAGAREEFERVRRLVLTRHVNRSDLNNEIAGMRARMRSELSRSGPGGFDLKQDAGGIADIEFIIDYWVLSRSAEFPDLVEFPDNVRQLEALVRNGLISAERADRVRTIYLALRASVHELALIESDRTVPAGAFSEERAWVRDLWNEVFGA
ncbi:bifunctional [glutamate--ammonia ligase]-adenylyl-L-tyrosine phosphorylase/[glutamate--ammonia-ligase] adenylyltransferase [Candidatus Rariloculus sp.]|uniref:bifunctional [glutamate--ammonia ligase]-adenylyl-L-tyrosine phosphorylase/[glutamate--ammonia-ligase] adenylyltransferase n=1 Tax=Candidatus Rariloculus sp. TaxID=3101265 RepID=UPI003D0F53A1